MKTSIVDTLSQLESVPRHAFMETLCRALLSTFRKEKRESSFHWYYILCEVQAP
jgi:hypothetical protein